LILDIIHATDYRGDTTNVLLGETHPHRLAWVYAYLELLLAEQTDAVIAALEAEGHAYTQTTAPRQAVRRTVGDYRRNRPYMCDDEYLARGWTIGTGVVEGALWTPRPPRPNLPPGDKAMLPELAANDGPGSRCASVLTDELMRCLAWSSGDRGYVDKASARKSIPHRVSGGILR
jgi:hypothetical protein